MPIVQIHLLEGRTPERKAELIAAVTEACCPACGSRPEAVRIILEEMKRENFGKGGKPFDL